MKTTIYSGFQLLKERERVTKPIWSLQKKKKIESKGFFQRLFKTSKKASSIRLNPDVINFTGRGHSPAFSRELNYITKILPDETFKSTKLSKITTQRILRIIHHFFLSLAITNRLRIIFFSPKYSSFLKEQTLSFIVEYIIYKHQMKTVRPKAVLIHHISPSDHNLALVFAALENKVPVICIQHGACSALLPTEKPSRLPVDLLLLKSLAVYENLRLTLSPEKIFYYGIPIPELPMKQIPTKIEILGICLTFLPNNEQLEQLILSLEKLFAKKTLYIRFHPRDPRLKTYKRINITLSPKGENIQEFAKKCDLVITGNTSAILEILKTGTPVIHLNNIDVGNDWYGFSKKIIPSFENTSTISLQVARSNYKTSRWAKEFSHFDSSYKKDRNKIDIELKKKLKDLLAPSCTQTPHDKDV